MTLASRELFGALSGMSRLGVVAYSAYGYGSRSSSLLGFNGERLDQFIFSYQLGNGYRLFDPGLMRFYAPDSMSPFGRGGLNSYGYCQGDPINLQDPSGHFSVMRLLSKLFSRRQKAPARGGLPTETPRANGRKPLPPGFELVGFHGSNIMHKQSLEASVVIQSGGINRFGKGFYFSQDRAVAESYTTHHGAQGHVYGVYAKDFKGWTEGLDFVYAGDSETMMVRFYASNRVVVREYAEGPLVRRNSFIIRNQGSSAIPLR